jgi:hypothetical protein
MRTAEIDRAANELGRGLDALAGYGDEQTLSRAPAIIWDDAGDPIFCFNDGRLVRQDGQSAARPSIRASSPK